MSLLSTKEIMEFEQIYDAVSQMILRINKSLPQEGYHKDNEEWNNTEGG